MEDLKKWRILHISGYFYGGFLNGGKKIASTQKSSIGYSIFQVYVGGVSTAAAEGR